jgi:hypothetical protein
LIWEVRSRGAVRRIKFETGRRPILLPEGCRGEGVKVRTCSLCEAVYAGKGKRQAFGSAGPLASRMKQHVCPKCERNFMNRALRAWANNRNFELPKQLEYYFGTLQGRLMDEWVKAQHAS